MEAIKYSKLIDVGYFYGGLSGKSKDDFEDGNAKFITYMNVFSNPSLKTNVDDKVRIEEDEKQNVVKYGDVIFTTSSETPYECGMSSVLEEHTDEPLYLNSFCFGYRFNDVQAVVPAFFKHLFRSNSIRAKIAKTANGVTRFNVSKKLFGEIEIPIPPIEIQEKIANQLDSFTSMITNLETELATRQKQYEYYRHELLAKEEENNNNPVLKLVDCANILYGYPFESNQFTEDSTYIPLVRIRDVVPGIASTYYKGKVLSDYIIKAGDILVGMDGNFNLAKWKDIDGLLNQRTLKISAKDELCYDGYLYHLLGPIFKRIELNTAGGSVKHLSAKTINQIQIKVPSLQKQAEIVSTLDTFESLITNIKQELEARKKQYEYYREQLLTFG